MQFSNSTYDKAKYFVLIVIPSIGTAVFGLGQIYGFDSTKALGTLTILAAFLGSLLGLSSKTYNADDPGFDGALHIHTDTSGAKVIQLELNDDDVGLVEEKDKAAFHVKVEDNEFWSND